MIPTTDHYIAQSLKEFLNYKTLKDLRAFSNVTGSLTSYNPKFQGLKAFGSPYAGFVYDSGISGAIVPTGLAGVSGSRVDYRNGRFLAPSGASYTGNSSFSVCDFNYYVTSSSDSKLIFETKALQAPVLSSATGYVEPKSVVAPCVFVKNFSSSSEDHCLGGESKLSWNFKIVCLARTEYELLGIQKVVRDSRQEIFPFITGSVLNQYGSLSQPGWTYQSEMDEMTDYCFVEDSTFKIVESDVFADDNPKMFVGMGNIEVSYYSNPRENSRHNTDVFLQLYSGEYLEL